MSVNTNDVSISTAVIEIKTIRVGNKQLTKAVFNQIPEKELIDIDKNLVRLDGTPWGLVKAESKCMHPGLLVRFEWWVLWQKGSKLYKCPLRLDPTAYTYDRAGNCFRYTDLIKSGTVEYKALWSIIFQLKELDQLFIAV